MRLRTRRFVVSGDSGTCGEMPRGADLVLVGANVFTGSQRRRWAKALAIQDGRILAVGTEGQVSRAADRGTRRLDLHGRIVVPGLIDPHTHMADSAGELGWTRLDRTRSMTEAIARLRKAAARTARGAWVIGVDWVEAKWTERRYPMRDDLDRASRDRAVVARRIDCHMGSLNSVALAAARDLVGLPGFEEDRSGRPTGSLRAQAVAQLHDRFA